MEQLFIEPPKFEKVAKTILKPDAATWSKEILSEFYETFPYLMNYPVQLQLKKKDERRGYAVGVIQLQNVTVPVIVENYELYPFDVAYINGTPLPFTAETVATVFSNPTAYASLRKFDYDDTTNKLFGQDRGLVQPERSYKQASLMDKLAGRFSASARDELLQVIQRDPAIQAGFTINDTSSVIDKLASLKSLSEVDFKSGIVHSIPRDISQLTKIGEDTYRLRIGSSSIYDPLEITVNELQAKKFQEKLAGKLDTKKTTKPSKIGGLSTEHHVVNVGERVFIVTKKPDGYKYFEVPRKYREKLKTSNDGLKKSASFDVSDEGFLSINGKYVGPVTIENIEVVPGSERVAKITVDNGLAKIAYVPLKGIKTQLPHQDLPNTFYIPEDSVGFVKAAQVEVEESVISRSSHEISCNAPGSFALRGPKFEKFAEKFDVQVGGISADDAQWILKQCSVEDNIDFSKITEGTSVPVSTNPVVPLSVDELNAQIKLSFSREIEDARLAAIDLIKEASAIPDKTTVDAVLSLGLLSSDNVLEFIDQVPLLEQVASYLAKLLISSRMGLRIVPEKAIKRAMEGLAVIIETLRAVEAIRKPVK